MPPDEPEWSICCDTFFFFNHCGLFVSKKQIIMTHLCRSDFTTDWSGKVSFLFFRIIPFNHDSAI